jgi:hypothetical protein
MPHDELHADDIGAAQNPAVSKSDDELGSLRADLAAERPGIRACRQQTKGENEKEIPHGRILPYHGTGTVRRCLPQVGSMFNPA